MPCFRFRMLFLMYGLFERPIFSSNRNHRNPAPAGLGRVAPMWAVSITSLHSDITMLYVICRKSAQKLKIRVYFPRWVPKLPHQCNGTERQARFACNAAHPRGGPRHPSRSLACFVLTLRNGSVLFLGRRGPPSLSIPTALSSKGEPAKQYVEALQVTRQGLL